MVAPTPFHAPPVGPWQLAPQLDECVELELQYKKAALDVEVLTEVGDACKAQLKELKASAAAEEEADRMALVELMNAGCAPPS